jgi:Mtf2 family
MPFLYQTRTLSQVRHRQKTALHFIQSAPAHTRRCLYDSSIPISRVGVSSKPSRRVYKPSSFHNGDGERLEGRNADGIPWEDSSGVMDMDEEQRAFITRIREIPFENGENFSDESDPFADDNIFNDKQEDLHTSPEETTRPVRESTITNTERHAFERIFADILARSKSAGAEAALSSSPSNNKAAVLTKQSGRARNAKESARSIMHEAANTVSSRQTKSIASPLGSKTAEELRADVDQYPIPLRAAAARALGLVSGRSEPLQEEIISNANELENIRQPERERVESLMRNAKTDIELWQVIEAEVFALVGKLGLEEKPKIPDEGSKPRGRKGKKEASKVAKDAVTTPDTDQPLDLNIYGPLYPSHVLLGLRLLDRSFAKPSPLVLNVLPRIKSLGIVSHVLGASTAFYNELLRIYWVRYDDFLGVLKLLNEMEQAGLEFDEETLSIVNEINQAQLKVKRGDRGSVLQALWSMPEFAPGKFRGWKEKIQASVEEQGTNNSDEVAWGA